MSELELRLRDFRIDKDRQFFLWQQEVNSRVLMKCWSEKIPICFVMFDDDEVLVSLPLAPTVRVSVTVAESCHPSQNGINFDHWSLSNCTLPLSQKASSQERHLSSAIAVIVTAARFMCPLVHTRLGPFPAHFYPGPCHYQACKSVKLSALDLGNNCSGYAMQTRGFSPWRQNHWDHPRHSASEDRIRSLVRHILSLSRYL